MGKRAPEAAEVERSDSEVPEITEDAVELAAAVLSREFGYTIEGSWYHLYAKPLAKEMLEAAFKK